MLTNKTLCLGLLQGRALGDRTRYTHVVVEFTDFFCPHCQDAHKSVMEPLIKNYVSVGRWGTHMLTWIVLQHSKWELAKSNTHLHVHIQTVYAHSRKYICMYMHTWMRRRRSLSIPSSEIVCNTQ